MAHPQVDDLTAVVRRAFGPGGEGGVRLVIPSAELVILEFVTIPHHIDDGFGKVQYIDEDLLLLPRYGTLSDGDIARWLKRRGIRMLDRSRELDGLRPNVKWAMPVDDARAGSEVALDALVELYGVPPSEGLFITDYPNHDDWPNPRPCPGVWPPL